MKLVISILMVLGISSTVFAQQSDVTERSLVVHTNVGEEPRLILQSILPEIQNLQVEKLITDYFSDGKKVEICIQLRSKEDVLQMREKLGAFSTVYTMSGGCH